MNLKTISQGNMASAGENGLGPGATDGRPGLQTDRAELLSSLGILLRGSLYGGVGQRVQFKGKSLRLGKKGRCAKNFLSHHQCPNPLEVEV